MDVKVLVATHKKYDMPSEDIYLPIHVGREGKEDLGYQGDNQGENISLKNSNYCELTGLYWAWKNLQCDVIGLSHYRRYFTDKSKFEVAKNKNNKMDLILNKQDIEKILKNADIIVPKKRNYYIETIYSHYKNAHHIKDLDETRNIIEELYPEYLENFDRVMNGKTIHLYNMFVMKKELFDEYCEWLFNILFELEKRVDISDYDAYQSRIFEFIRERLFNVWILQKNMLSREIDVINIESIEWMPKIINFMKRKFK